MKYRVWFFVGLGLATLLTLMIGAIYCSDLSNWWIVGGGIVVLTVVIRTMIKSPENINPFLMLTGSVTFSLAILYGLGNVIVCSNNLIKGIQQVLGIVSVFGFLIAACVYAYKRTKESILPLINLWISLLSLVLLVIAIKSEADTLKILAVIGGVTAITVSGFYSKSKQSFKPILITIGTLIGLCALSVLLIEVIKIPQIIQGLRNVASDERVASHDVIFNVLGVVTLFAGIIIMVKQSAKVLPIWGVLGFFTLAIGLTAEIIYPDDKVTPAVIFQTIGALVLVLSVLGGLFAGLKARITYKLNTYYRLPVEQLELEAVPAVPIHIKGSLNTLLTRLPSRRKAIKSVQYGLTEEYKLKYENKEEIGTGYEFLYHTANSQLDTKEKKNLRTDLYWTIFRMVFLPINWALAPLLKKRVNLEQRVSSKQQEEAKDDYYHKLSLSKPEDFKISWSNYYNIYKVGENHPKSADWMKALSNKEIATREFWPTIANYGLAYNLMILEKIEHLTELKENYLDEWPQEVRTAHEKGALYAIDMTIHEKFDWSKAEEEEEIVRFTPSTYTLLRRNSENKLEPFMIWVSGKKDRDTTPTLFRSTDAAWLYALQAAKVSITVYGIWLGHVYHWHIVTAAMQMYMYKNFSEEHILYQMLSPISKYLVAFDDILLLLWEEIAPPTSFNTAGSYLEYTNEFAKERKYHDDDPKEKLKKQKLKQTDFTVDSNWSEYQLVAYELEVWDITEKYITTMVNDNYKNNSEVEKDQQLKNWINDCSDKSKGNIKGIEKVTTREELIKVLTSYVFRITIHGASRLISSANPALSFIGNFPPCLQKKEIPAPNVKLATEELLEYLPNTGTIGTMMNFYNIFSFTSPYESLIPAEGIDAHLFYKTSNETVATIENKNNKTLIEFREDMKAFIGKYGEDDIVHQWPLNIET